MCNCRIQNELKEDHFLVFDSVLKNKLENNIYIYIYIYIYIWANLLLARQIPITGADSANLNIAHNIFSSFGLNKKLVVPKI
jgi:hypothetical protein